MSLTPAGKAANGASENGTISADGRYVCFVSLAGDLTMGDANSKADVFVRDLQERTTTLVSILPCGASPSGSSESPSMTPDGRHVAFLSNANLAPQGLNNRGGPDVYWRDLQAPVGEGVKLMSGDPAGRAGGKASEVPPAISDDGRFVAFTDQDPLLAADQNAFNDVYIRDLQLAATDLVSVTAGGRAGNGDSQFPALSADGRFVAYVSTATDLTAIRDVNGPNADDVFIYDRTSRTTRLASVNSSGTAAGNGSSLRQAPTFSADGRYVAWISFASDLAPGVADGNGTTDLYARDLQTNATALVSVNTGGTAAGNMAGTNTLLSKDGHYCVFASTADDLVPGDVNGKADVFRRDLFNRQTVLVSHVAGGTTPGNGDSGANNSLGLSADGAVVLFESSATNLAPGDGNFEEDVYAAAPAAAPPPPLPALTSPATNPTALPWSGGKVTLSVDVTSAAPLTRVEALLTPTRASTISVVLKLKSGTTYEGVYTASANGSTAPRTFGVVFAATNAAGGTRSLPGLSFTLAAPKPPVLSNPRATPLVLPASGGKVTMTVDATGETALTSVTGTFIYPYETVKPVTLAHQSGTTYSGVFTLPANPSVHVMEHHFAFTATDSRGLQTTVVGGYVLVASAAPITITECKSTPEPVPPVTTADLDRVTVSARISTPTPALGTSATVELWIAGKEVAYAAMKPADFNGLVTASLHCGANTGTAPRRLEFRIVATDQDDRSTAAACTGTQDLLRPPTVTNCRATPVHVGIAGGTVTCSAEIDHVYGPVAPVCSLYFGNTLIGQALAKPVSGKTYAASVTLPPNPTATPPSP